MGREGCCALAGLPHTQLFRSSPVGDWIESQPPSLPACPQPRADWPLEPRVGHSVAQEKCCHVVVSGESDTHPDLAVWPQAPWASVSLSVKLGLNETPSFGH